MGLFFGLSDVQGGVMGDEMSATEILTMRIPCALADDIKRIARRELRTKSNVVHLLVAEAVAARRQRGGGEL